MNNKLTPILRSLSATLVAACSLSTTGVAHAENHALIMTVNYAGTTNALPGIDKDAATAHKIAQGMGVPSQNIKWVQNADLTLAGMSAAINELVQNRISDGDKVFLYYSGHGYQKSGSGGKCIESLVTSDVKFFEDEQLQQTLNTLAAKASQVVMFNDSCFSGGAATKDLELRSARPDNSVPKVFHDKDAGSSADADYACGQATNKDFGSRTLGVVASKRPSQMLYVAASSDHEVSRASPNGSWATQAWAHCLSSKAADRNGNGFVDGEELVKCSQEYIDKNFPRKQTVTSVGNEKLIMRFAGSGSDSGSGSVTPVTNGRGTLESLRAAADTSIKVGLSVAKNRLKIQRDMLDLSVDVARGGYLHLLHVASDGKFYVLFPNKIDGNNYVKAGTHRLPKQAWGIQAQGPAGTSYVMAYVSDAPRDFSKDLDANETFASGESNSDTTRKLAVIALSGRYGASPVVAIQEVN